MLQYLLLLICILIGVSCNSRKENESESVDVPDDWAKEVYDSTENEFSFPPIFEMAFKVGTRSMYMESPMQFRTFEIGVLKVESGKIIACDPIIIPDVQPFVQHFPIGEYVVQLAMAYFESDERVAFARIKFSDNAVAKWELALLPGQVPISITDTTIYCYHVDAGTGVFIDAVANEVLDLNSQAKWEKIFIDMAERTGYRGHMYNFKNHNLATFSTGFGDGCYATYVGRDNDGNICRLLTDFGLVEWWREKYSQ